MWDRAIPASALNEEEDEEDDEAVGEMRDDERSGTRYNVRRIYFALSFFDTYQSKSSFTVFLVPHYLRHRRYVRRHATH